MSDGMTEMNKREEKEAKVKKKSFCKKSHKYVEKDRAKQLVDDHWKYVEKVLLHAYDVDLNSNMETIKAIEFHYKSSGIHFYGHAVEDMEKEHEL